MDLQTCLQKLQYVGILTFATVDAAGAPQLRQISAIHFALDDSTPALYFFTARGKDFCRELLAAQLFTRAAVLETCRGQRRCRLERC